MSSSGWPLKHAGAAANVIMGGGNRGEHLFDLGDMQLG